MKKLMSLMLGLGLILGTTSFAVAESADTTKKAKKTAKSKAKKTATSTEKKPVLR